MTSIAETADPRALIEVADPCAPAREGILEVPGRLQLYHGGSLQGVRLAWRLTGPAAAPVVAALGGISAHRVVYSEGQAQRGWWDGVVGPGRALDATRFRILGIDYLGGSGATSGPRDAERFNTQFIGRVRDEVGADQASC